MNVKYPCVINEINYGGEKAIKKTFEQGRLDKEFANESEAYRVFSGYKWFPHIHEIGDHYVIYKYYGPSNGWSNSVYKENISYLPQEKKDILLEKIIFAIYDIYEKGYAHRDLHSLNIFYSPTALDIIIIDFELMCKYQTQIPFLSSYDVIGVGLESPYDSLNNCIMKEYPYSIKNSFGIKSVQEIEGILNKRSQ